MLVVEEGPPNLVCNYCKNKSKTPMLLIKRNGTLEEDVRLRLCIDCWSKINKRCEQVVNKIKSNAKGE
jgi:hypothetical protein